MLSSWQRFVRQLIESYRFHTMNTEVSKPISPPSVVSEAEWLAARKQLLQRERELTHLRDAVAAERRALPWVKVEKSYVFDTPKGPKTLSDLFQGRNQLFVYHFMLSPDSDHICEGCSLLSDHTDGARQHFEQADLSFVAISRATLKQIEAVKKRLGWVFPWVSSGGTSFNYDYGVSFTAEQVASGDVGYNYGTTKAAYEDLHGASVFARDADGVVYHTYSTYARGCEIIANAFNFLDLAPKGRNENGETMSWVKLHDEYATEPNTSASSCCSTKESCCS